MSDENQSTPLSEDKISFRDNDHGNLLCEQMYQYYKEQTFCDIIVKADSSTPNNEICAHRSVLSAHSEYFSNIFRGRTQFDNQTEIIIENITEEMLRKIIEYCYTGIFQVENNKDSVEELLKNARYFKIKFLEETSIQCLVKNSLLWALDVYRLNSFEEYSEKIREILFGNICENFIQLYKSEEFLTLNADKLAKLITQDNIRVKSEKNVLDALLVWLNYNFDERQQHIGTLLPLIRFPFLQPTYIFKQLKTICKSNENMQLMLEALEWHNVPENRVTLEWICTKERQFGSLIMIIGDGTQTDSSKFFEVYDNLLNKSFHCDIMPKGKTSFIDIAATVIDDELIVAGGFYEPLLNTVYKLNLTTTTWSQLPSMLEGRSQFKLIVLQHKIYAVGGVRTRSVECWDPTTNVWKYVREMSTERYRHGAIVLDNKLYALGGRNSKGSLSSVECYDANLNRWTTKASMNQNRETFMVGILNDELYAIGGYGSGSSVERYNAKADKWKLLYTLNTLNRLRLLSAHNCFIGTAYIDNSMEIVKYDPVTNKTTTLHQLKYVRLHYEVLAIPYIMLNKFP